MNNTTEQITNGLQDTITNTIKIIIIILTFLITVTYIIFVLTHKTFRSNKLNWPTVNIALATAFFSLNQFIFTITGDEKFLVIPCRLQGFILSMAAYQMMYSYCVSSFNRLLAIRYFNKALFRSNRWLLTSIVISWIVGSLFAIPYALYDSFTCSSNGFSIILKLYSCITILIVPIHIVTICNILIFRYIHQVSRRIHDTNNNKHNNSISRKRDSHISKIMSLTFCLFVIGWAPVLFEQLFNNSDHQLPQSVSLFFQFLLTISLFGQMILLIYANQPLCQYIKKKIICNR